MAFLIVVATATVAKAQTERKMTVDELFQLGGKQQQDSSTREDKRRIC